MYFLGPTWAGVALWLLGIGCATGDGATMTREMIWRFGLGEVSDGNGNDSDNDGYAVKRFCLA